MRILVLGGTRFFGIHLVNCLVASGHEVTLLTRGNLPSPCFGQTEHIVADRTNLVGLRQSLQGRQFDAVVDNIAYCSEDVRGILDAVETKRYVLTSSGSVYNPHPWIHEEEFDPYTYPLRWGGREAFDYCEGKRQAEAALFQAFPQISAVAVRFPFVIGTDDYTRRLYFYAEHVARGIPMRITELDQPLGFIRSGEAGSFLAWLAERTFTGSVNAANGGHAVMRAVLSRLEEISGQEAVLGGTDEAPYNGIGEGFTLCTERAGEWGYAFPPLESFFDNLLFELVRQAVVS